MWYHFIVMRLQEQMYVLAVVYPIPSLGGTISTDCPTNQKASPGYEWLIHDLCSDWSFLSCMYNMFLEL